MANEKIELVSSKDNRGVAGRKVDGVFESNPNIISTAALSSQPDFNIPTVSPSTSVQGELGRLSGIADDFQSTQDAFARQQEERARQAQSTEAQSFAALQAEILGTPTRSELEAEAFSQRGGVDDLQKELNAITADLRGEQRSLELRLRELDKNPQGLLKGALEDEKRRIQTESLQRQADISIIGMAAQDRFDSAKAIADRTINAITEQNQKRIDFYQEVYDRNSALFDKAETRAFETAQADRERKLANEEADARALSAAKLEAIKMAQLNGAPASVLASIQASQTPEEVFTKGGQYASVDLLDRAIKSEQLSSLRNKPAALRPTSVIDQGGRKLLIDTQTGEVIQDFGTTNVDTEELQRASNEQAVKQVYDLRSHKGFNSSVGPIGLARIALIDKFGAKDDFIAGIDNLTKDLTLDNLIKAKEEGATFGALSNAELSLLAESATKINNWRKGERGSDGSIIVTSGYDASQKDFMKELDRIAYFRALDAYKKGSKPQDVGLATTPDGKVWFRNGDGSVQEIK